MKIANEVLAVLDAAEKSGNALTLVGQLERNLYTAVNKVLEAAGGKWNRKTKAHLFEGDAADAMEQIILTGEIGIPQELGWFPSPPPVVKRLIELAEIKEGMRAFEPSAGEGAIVQAMQAAGALVWACEIEAKRAAKVGQMLYPEGACTVGDFLSMHPPKPADAILDRVVMNPPFAKKADIKHVTHALRFLKPGGRLVSVMSAGIQFRTDKDFVAFFDLMGQQKSFRCEGLPDGSFKSSGTGVNTVIVVVDKK